MRVEDTGRYTCMATNEYGQASTSAFFRVLKGTHFVILTVLEDANFDLDERSGERGKGWGEGASALNCLIKLFSAKFRDHFKAVPFILFKAKHLAVQYITL